MSQPFHAQKDLHVCKLALPNNIQFSQNGISTQAEISMKLGANKVTLE